MSHSVTYYVDVSVLLDGTGATPAGFGIPLFLHATDSVGASERIQGPFTSVTGLTDYGYAAGSPPVVAATTLFTQSPRVNQFYVGRIDSGDANLTESLTTITAVNPGLAYCYLMESRAAQDILDLNTFISARSKIAIVQSNDASILSGVGPTYTLQVTGTPTDGNYIWTFTGFGLSSPVTVTVARSTTPSTNDDLAAALDAQLDTQAGTDLAAVLVPSSITSVDDTVTLRIIDGLDTGTITFSHSVGGGTSTITLTDADIASRLFDTQSTRTALIYHPTDTEYLDVGWASRCLSFNLDQKKGGWFAKRINGFNGTSLDDSEVTAIRNTNCNYFAPATSTSGTTIAAFTAQGWFPSGSAGAGRRIDVTTSIDWLQARLEEALINVNLIETHGVGFDDNGIARYKAAVRRVLNLGLAAGHLVEFEVPADDTSFPGLKTPAIIGIPFSQTTTTQRTNREYTFTAVAYLKSQIEKVVFTLNLRQ